MKDIATRPPLDGKDLDAAIDHARAALAALLRILGGGDGASYPKMLAEARALIGALLDRRVALAAARMDERDADAVAAARADRNEAIAVTGALLYWLPADDAAWPEVALTLGRLSYDRYTDPWLDAEPPDPDDLDAACDLLLRGARYDDADERTTLYLFLALRDRQHLMACPKDARALMTWGERLLAFPDAGGLGRSGLQDMLELELLDRVESLARAGSWGPWGRPLRLATETEGPRSMPALPLSPGICSRVPQPGMRHPAISGRSRQVRATAPQTGRHRTPAPAAPSLAYRTYRPPVSSRRQRGWSWMWHRAR